MGENTSFNRDDEGEADFGDKFSRPPVKVTFGDYKGHKYQGEWAYNPEGLIDLHGWGILAGSDGSWITQGYFRHGRPHGKSRTIGEDSYFEGSMLNGMRHGTGFVKNKKSRFDGTWEFDMREGKGKEKIFGKKCCNDRYCKDNIPELFVEGTWRNNKIHGIAIHRQGKKIQDVVYQHGVCKFDFDIANKKAEDKMASVPQLFQEE